MKNTDILNRIMTMLSSKVELVQHTLEDGSTIECSTYEVGADVFKVDGDDKEPLAAGEYTLEDGSKLSVVEIGKIAKIEPKDELKDEEMKAEDKEKMAEAELSYDEEGKDKMAEVPATLEEIVKSVMDAVMPMINDLQAKIEAMGGMEKDMKEVKEKLSSKIITKPTTHKPTEIKTNLSNLAPNVSETQARIYAMLSK